MRFNGKVAFLSWGVMRQGGMLAIGRYCAEAEAKVAGRCKTQGVYLFRGGKLGHLLLANGVLYPAHEARYGKAVLYMRLAHVLYLNGVLYGLLELFRVHLVHYYGLFGELFIKRIVHRGRAEQNGIALVIAGGEGVNIVIRQQRNVELAQIFLYAGMEFAFVRENIGRVALNNGIGEEHGIAFNVPAAQVEQPCNVVQRTQNVRIGILFIKHTAYVRKLIRRAYANAVQPQHIYRRGGQGGAILPNFADKIHVLLNGHVLCGKRLFHAHCRCGGYRAPVHAYNGAFGQGGKVFHGGRHALLTHLHKLYGGTLYLLLSLNEVAPVYPQRGFRHGYDKRAC